MWGRVLEEWRVVVEEESVVVQGEDGRGVGLCSGRGRAEKK